MWKGSLQYLFIIRSAFKISESEFKDVIVVPINGMSMIFEGFFANKATSLIFCKELFVRIKLVSESMVET